jgi:integrative and conjugative element protein (TIGR02256 family)
MHMQNVSAWISSATWKLLATEAPSRHPQETGGVLIGYWADPNTVVISASVGPGPDSIHGRYTYEHDHVWEASQIALHYTRSGRSETYIGDWHTHPDAASGVLSSTDRRSLRRVLGAREARLSRSLMMVLFGHPNQWHADIWLAEFEHAAWRWRPKLSITSVRTVSFDNQF